ncbi:FecR family protein [Proteiniphilum sp. UBA5384]|uniref:FecR family protein n=1 Tax=Proteiniphilum sp. UBA5384 TaxID=1947279 RepID=UPI0025E39A67|nr:FecR family protein [Proteiniphilum sp. UBA5384]
MDYFKRIIDFFTRGKFSESGMQAFYEWLSDEAYSEEKDQTLKAFWDQTYHKADAKTRESWKTFRRKAGMKDKTPHIRVRIWQSAAAVLLVISLSAVYTAYKFHENSSSIDLIEQYVPVATTDRVVLPDGSEVHLNSGSMLLYPEEFTGNSRSVYLSGEANFKVKQNKEKPFIIKSNDFRVTVLGTEFDMLAYPEDSLVRVTLFTGSIEASYNNLDEHTILTPNQQLVYNKISGASYIHHPDIEDVTAWQRGEIVFKGTTLNEIITVLKRKYPYEFVYYPEQLSNDTYTFRFKDDAPVKEVMEIISQVVGYIRYRIVDNTCFIESISK